MSRTVILSPHCCKLASQLNHVRLLTCISALSGHFAALEEEDDRGINETRAMACEVVAWRFVTNLSGREAMDYLLYDLPPSSIHPDSADDEEAGHIYPDSNGHGQGHHSRQQSYERTPLITGPRAQVLRPTYLRSTSNFATDRVNFGGPSLEDSETFAAQFANLNSLEVAAVSGAKKFLSQRAIQRIVESICMWSGVYWMDFMCLNSANASVGKGDIIFWETLSVNSVKKPKIYNRKYDVLVLP